MSVKLCKDCAHHHLINTGAFAPLTYGCSVEGLINLVDGKTVYRQCSHQRSDNGKCGPDAKLFEAYEE